MFLLYFSSVSFILVFCTPFRVPQVVCKHLSPLAYNAMGHVVASAMNAVMSPMAAPWLVVEWIFKILQYKKAETNFKIAVRWLSPKTCLLPHPWDPVGVKFHEFVITQLLAEVENWFWAQKMRKTSFY